MDAANRVTGAGVAKREVAEVALRLSADLIDHRCPPGDLVADDRDFVPWTGTGGDQLRRLAAEMETFLAQGKLPMPTELCWFHRPGQASA